MLSRNCNSYARASENGSTEQPLVGEFLNAFKNKLCVINIKTQYPSPGNFVMPVPTPPQQLYYSIFLIYSRAKKILFSSAFLI